MFIALLLIWFILNEHITLEIALFGIVFAGVLYLFACRFLNFSVKKDLSLIKRLPWLFWFVLVLLWEIVKANIAVLKIVLRPGCSPSPVLVKVRTPLKRRFGRALYANCITLTPGTITVSLEDGLYTVHCLDESFAEGLDTARLIGIIAKLEG